MDKYVHIPQLRLVFFLLPSKIKRDETETMPNLKKKLKIEEKL